MIHPQDGNKSLRSSALLEMRTTIFFQSKEDVVQSVTDLLTKLDPNEILQSITITVPEKSEGYYVTDVITFC
jgi:hypothetical protein